MKPVARGATAASISTVVRNTTNRALKFTVKPRPWRQSKSGGVRAIRSRTLRGVGLSAKRFKLGAGKSRRVYVTMGSVPSRGSLYGALIGTIAFMWFEDVVSAANPFHWLTMVGVLLIAVVLFAPKGLYGSSVVLASRLGKRFSEKSK